MDEDLAGAAGHPTQEDLHIAGLLALGLKDEAVVKRLAISHRTYRRRVRHLMDKLGARSRFEAGVLAERAGWVGRRSSAAAALEQVVEDDARVEGAHGCLLEKQRPQ